MVKLKASGRPPLTNGITNASRIRTTVRGVVLILSAGIVVSAGFAFLSAYWNQVPIKPLDLSITGILVAVLAAFYAHSQFELTCWAMIQAEEGRIDNGEARVATLDLQLSVARVEGRVLDIHTAILEGTNHLLEVGNTQTEASVKLLIVLNAIARDVAALRDSARVPPVSINMSLFGSDAPTAVANAVAKHEQHDAGND